MFRTTNGGLTWDDVWSKATVGAIGAVTIATSNKNVVWVGTGESKPRNDASYGDGVWVSRDGGKSWSHKGLVRSHAIAKILVDPANPNVALAGALGNPFRDGGERGVYRTTDGGATWQQTLVPGPQSGASDMDWDARGRTVFAGIWQFRRVPWNFTSGGPQSGLYKSNNGGRTWRRLRGNGLPTGIVGRIGVAVAPSDPKRVYALIQSTQGLLWRSDDAGEQWRMMSRDTIVDQRPFYMSRLAVDPTNANHVFFASEDLIESRDGGRTFRQVPNAVHQDHHGMWIAHNGRRMIEADDGSAPISLDGGNLWDWRFNAVIGQIYHVGYDEQNPYHVCGGFQDNDSFCGPANSLSPLGILNSDWRDVGNDGDGSWAWPEPGNPSAVWNVGVNALNGQLGIYDYASRQNFDISPFVRDTNGRKLEGLPYRFNWEAPVAFSPRKPGIAYFGGNVVFATTDRGRSWNAISPDLTRNDPAKQQVAGGPINTDVSGAEFYDTILSIAPSPLDPQVIWVGTDDGLVQLTKDGGAHWQDVTMPQIAPWGRVAVEPSHALPGGAFVTVDRHLLGDRTPYLFETSDDGATWHSLAAGLPQDENARIVRQDPVNGDVLYAGLEQGAWISLDHGTHWQSLRSNMPPVSVPDLQVQPAAGDLIAATHGRGFWILDDLAPLRDFRAAFAAGVPTLFAIRPVYHWYLWWSDVYGTGDGECCAPAGAFAGDNPDEGAVVTYYLPTEPRAKPNVEVVDAKGTVVRHFDGSGSLGVNRISWDLTEDPPAAWEAAREWNKGPKSGVDVVPGTYTVRIHAGTTLLSGEVSVRADPRASWTLAQYVERHDFLRTLDGELSAIDRALNDLDARRRKATPAARARIDAVLAQLTSSPMNPEDDQWRPDGLRERIQTLIGTLALSQGPPLPPKQREADEIRVEYDAALATYRSYLEHEGLR